MAQPAAFPASDHDFEVSLPEARTRFVQLVRVAGLTGRPVTITDHGRPMATIVPATAPRQRSGVPRPVDAADSGGATQPHTRAGAGRAKVETDLQRADARRQRAEVSRQAQAERERAENFREAEAARRHGDLSWPRSGRQPGDPVQAQPGPGDSQRAQAVAAGWARRLEQVRATQQRQHATEMASLAQALAEAWRVINHLRPNGTDPGIDRLRTEHRELLRASSEAARGQSI
jgi:prevent-host-death family protein